MPEPYELDDDPPRRRRREDDDDYDDRPRRPRRRRNEDDDRPRGPETNGAASAAVVLGIIALLPTIIGVGMIVAGGGDGGWMPMLGSMVLWLSGLLGLPATICGGIGLTRRVKRGTATFGLLLGILGMLVGIGGLVYSMSASVSKVRDAATRTQDSNNLNLIALGADNYHSANVQVPPATEDLSWRVYLLPYLEQDTLYRRFNMKEPWDSPTNLPHSRIRVKEYASTLDGPAATDTRYRVFVGDNTLFPPRQKWGPARIGWTSVTDGTSNTIFAIEAAETVPWPQPKELTYNPKGPLPELGHPKRPDVFLVVMADGAVRIVRKDRISEQTLRALITRNGGEVAGKDW